MTQGLEISLEDSKRDEPRQGNANANHRVIQPLRIAFQR